MKTASCQRRNASCYHPCWTTASSLRWQGTYHIISYEGHERWGARGRSPCLCCQRAVSLCCECMCVCVCIRCVCAVQGAGLPTEVLLELCRAGGDLTARESAVCTQPKRGLAQAKAKQKGCQWCAGLTAKRLRPRPQPHRSLQLSLHRTTPQPDIRHPTPNTPYKVHRTHNHHHTPPHDTPPRTPNTTPPTHTPPPHLSWMCG